METNPEQMVIRPVREADLDELMALLHSITSLQPHRAYLQMKIEDSLRSFYPVVRRPGPEKYFFVLEDLAAGRLAGTCWIAARTGGYEPCYTYKIVKNVFRHEALDITSHIEELHLHLDHEGPSELGGLYLHPEYRGGGIGGALSRCRFLFARLFPERFTTEIMTEFRGVVTASGEVPFWEAIGRHFFIHDFFTLDQYSALARKDFIRDLMPRHPIYIQLLPASAREVIGKPHPAAVPAVRVVENEGFSFIHQVDIFDAGPVYRATLSKTITHQRSRIARVAAISFGHHSQSGVLVANTTLDFRVALGALTVNEDESVDLSPTLAQNLGVEPGDHVIYLPRHD
jgi:arginine N-succinyltransferase